MPSFAGWVESARPISLPGKWWASRTRPTLRERAITVQTIRRYNRRRDLSWGARRHGDHPRAAAVGGEPDRRGRGGGAAGQRGEGAAGERHRRRGLAGGGDGRAGGEGPGPGGR